MLWCTSKSCHTRKLQHLWTDWTLEPPPWLLQNNKSLCHHSFRSLKAHTFLCSFFHLQVCVFFHQKLGPEGTCQLQGILGNVVFCLLTSNVQEVKLEVVGGVLIEAIGSISHAEQIFYFEKKVKMVAFPRHFRCYSFSECRCSPFVNHGFTPFQSSFQNLSAFLSFDWV